MARLTETGVQELSDADVEAVASEAVALLSTRFGRDRNPLSERIGPTYRSEQLARYLPGVHSPAITSEAVRKRVKKNQLIAFRSRDRVWLFPAWQFSLGAGRLEPINPVIDAWADLPHDGLLADVDLVAWMATRRHDLDRQTPAKWAATHGYDERLRHAVRSVRRRVA